MKTLWWSFGDRGHASSPFKGRRGGPGQQGPEHWTRFPNVKPSLNVLFEAVTVFFMQLDETSPSFCWKPSRRKVRDALERICRFDNIRTYSEGSLSVIRDQLVMVRGNESLRNLLLGS